MTVPPPSTAPVPSPPPGDAAPAVPDPVEAAGFAWWSPFVAWVVASAGAIVFVTILAGLAGGTDADGDLPPGVTLGATFIQDVLLIVAMLAFARAGGARLSPAAFGLRRAPYGRAIGFAALVFVVFYAFLIAWSQLDTDAKDDLAAQLGARESTLALISVAVLVGIVAPIVEELFFRGFLFGALGRVMSWVPAALVSGVLFGLVHFGGTPAIFLVPLAVLGFLLCMLYRRIGSLLPGMGVHAFNNAFALGVTLSWTPAQIALAVIAAPVIVVAIAGSLSE